MDLKRVGTEIKRVTAVVAAIVCGAAALWLQRLVAKLHWLSAEIASVVGPEWRTVGPTDETTRTVPLWSATSLALAALGGALLCYAALNRQDPRPVAGEDTLRETSETLA